MSLEFRDLDPSVWIDSLPPYLSATVKTLIENGADYEEAAEILATQVGPENTVPFGTGSPQSNFLNAVKAELVKLICDDPAYSEQRTKIEKLWQEKKDVVLLSVASFIGSQIGVAAAVLLPIVGLLLSMVTAIGHNAWCAQQVSTNDDV